MRVAVTGLGVISALGVGVSAFWSNLTAGKSGTSLLTEPQFDDLKVRLGAVARDFDVTRCLPGDSRLERLDRCTQMAMAASAEAITESGLEQEFRNSDRIGVVLGTGVGAPITVERQITEMVQGGPRRVSPRMIPMTTANALPGEIAIRWGFRGINATVSTACSSGAQAIGWALLALRTEKADVVITGGADAPLCRILLAGFAAMRVLSQNHDRPNEACRPFDRWRDGFVLGEGAGVLVLERREHALARGAHIYCELLGFASRAEAYHMVIPSPNGEEPAACMLSALKDAEVSPSQVDYVTAHGTGTVANDLAETLAIHKALGTRAKEIPVVSMKGACGHTLGAAGAIEAVATALSVYWQKIPPTVNCREPAEECDLDYVIEGSRRVAVSYALCNSFGFGGSNACLVFGRGG